MVDIQTIIAGHRSRNKDSEDLPIRNSGNQPIASTSQIPDIFFDQILSEYKLTRIEIMVLMYIYREVWCRPNLYKVYGISQLMSHAEMAKNQGLTIEEVYSALRKLEDYGFISTIRSGQYFVRKYFTKDFDEFYAQTYDDFEI